MRTTRLTVISLNAKKISRLYRRRVWWVSLEDLEQEALCAQLAAERTFDREKGGFGGYAWRAAVFACHRYVLAQSAPVTSKHDPTELIGLYRADLAALGGDAERSSEVPTDEALAKARVIARVRARLAEILGEESVDFAVGMLSREYTPGEVAADHSVPEQRVYRAVRAVRDKVAGDQVLFDLWRDNS